MSQDSNRARPGRVVLRCTDCPATATIDPTRPPTFDHAWTCPIAVADRALAAADVAALAEMDPGAEYVRRLDWSEAQMFAVYGRPLPPRIRRRVRVTVTRVGPEHMLRSVKLDGVTRATALIVAPAMRTDQ